MYGRTEGIFCFWFVTAPGILGLGSSFWGLGAGEGWRWVVLGLGVRFEV